MSKPTRPRPPRRPLSEWLAVHLDVPADLTCGGLRLELLGRSTLTVHGVTRILTYTPTRICLALEKGTLAVEGERLLCASYLAGAVGVEGRVDRLSFEEEGL